MGKLTALIVGYISVTFASYAVLSLAYAPLVNWLGPYFGYRFPLILGIVYLIAGSPLRNSIILETWVIIGIIVGISARKGLRAWGSASLVYAFTTATVSIAAMGILGISLLGTGGIHGISGDISGTMATLLAATAFVPSGTNLATIAMEPVLRTIIPYISSVAGSGSISSGSVSSSIAPMIEGIAISALENYIIFVAVSIIVGSVSYRLIHGKKKISKKAVAASLAIFVSLLFVAMALSGGISSQGTPDMGAPSGSARAVPEQALNGLFPVTVHNGTASVATNSPASLSGSIENGSNDAGLSLITPQGNLYNFFAMENTSGSNTWDSTGLMFGSVAVTANMSSIITKEYGISLSSFGGFVPQNILVLGYMNSIGGGNAAVVSSSLGKTMGTTFNHIITLKNVTLSGYSLNVYIYSSPSGNAALKSGFMKAYADGHSGSISSIFAKDEGMNNYGPFAMASGYVNSTIAGKAAGISTGTGGMYFTAGIFGYEQYFHSSGTYHTYNLSTLMNYKSKVSFKDSSTLSLLGIGYNNGTGHLTSISGYKFNIYASNATLAEKTPLNTSGSEFTDVQYGSFSPSSVEVSFNAVFPASISYRTSVAMVSSNEARITVHITNNDNNTVREFNASQGAFVNNYDSHNASSLVSGKYMESNLTLSQGQSANFTYTMKLSGIGIYVIPYTNISYNFMGKPFAYQTNATYIDMAKPGYVSAMNSMVNSEASQYSFLGSVLFTFSGFAFSVIDLILLAIVLIDVAIEAGGLKKLIDERKGLNC